jgi:hypothetical protein
MRRRQTLPIAFAALLGALVSFALPALAGAQGGDHHRGNDHFEHRHHHRHGNRGHHQNFGRISAFDAGSGELTIARFGGGTITGLVNGSTEIKCEGRDDESMASLSRDGGSNSGPGGGGDRGEEEPGGDHGGQGEEEPGDDHGEAAEPGDDNSGPGRGDRNDDRVCTTADLTVGTVVHEADREFPGGVATFDEIELGHTS